MTTDPQTADIEYRLTRLEENIRALTGMVESLVVIRHVGGEAAELVPSTAETARDEIERTASDSGLLSRTDNDGAPLGEVVHDEAAELVPSTAETAALTAADLDALPEGTIVYDADGDGWAKTGTRWRLDNEGRPERAAALVKVYGPITATN